MRSMKGNYTSHLSRSHKIMRTLPEMIQDTYTTNGLYKLSQCIVRERVTVHAHHSACHDVVIIVI
jgi:hypothetical protein